MIITLTYYNIADNGDYLDEIYYDVEVTTDLKIEYLQSEINDSSSQCAKILKDTLNIIDDYLDDFFKHDDSFKEWLRERMLKRFRKEFGFEKESSYSSIYLDY